MEVKTVGIACDHAGFPLKQFVVEYLKTKGYAFKDFGTFSDESVDYPDFAHPRPLRTAKFIPVLPFVAVAREWL